MKSKLNHLLSRFPFIYRSVLRLMGSGNSEKLTFLTLVQDGQIVFDIGANRGVFTVLFSHIVGERGRVHAFEPVPPTFQVLSQHLANEQHYSNVVLNNFALGDNPGHFEIHVPAGDYAQASLQRHSVASWAQGNVETFRCEIRTLDDYVTEKGIDRIDFIKLDVEGAELAALRGGQRVLKELQPMIHLEFFPPWTEAFGYGAKELITLLQSLGYEYFYEGNLAPLRSPIEQLQTSTESQNVICSVKPLPYGKI